jgi:hypothetical protein
MTDLAVVPGAVAGELKPLCHLHFLDELLVVHHHGGLHVRVPRLPVPDTNQIPPETVLGTRDILVRIRFWIPGSVPLTKDPDPYFVLITLSTGTSFSV